MIHTAVAITEGDVISAGGDPPGNLGGRSSRRHQRRGPPGAGFRSHPGLAADLSSGPPSCGNIHAVLDWLSGQQAPGRLGPRPVRAHAGPQAPRRVTSESRPETTVSCWDQRWFQIGAVSSRCLTSLHRELALQTQLAFWFRRPGTRPALKKRSAQAERRPRANLPASTRSSIQEAVWPPRRATR